jgi:hypothetical protein
MARIRERSRGWFTMLAAGSLGLLGACAAQSANPLLPQPTPTCQLQPQATGEKYVAATVEASPPARASPGQEIIVVVSGAYGLVGNNAVVCGDGEVVEYVFSDGLPSFNWQRTVEVRLDGRTLSVVECENPCRIELILPPQTPVGMHELALVTRGVEPVTFEVEIAAP